VASTTRAGGSVVTEYVAVDLATGRQVWTAPVRVTGHEVPDVFPPVAAAGDLLLTDDPAGAVTARVAATGKVAWRHPRPAACGPAPGGEFSRTALEIAADGPLAAVSFGCSRTVVVQRLDAATGRALWSWRSPAAASGAVTMSVTGAARDGGMVLLTGAFGQATAAGQGTAALPRPYAWPARLGPSDQASLVLALAADGGQPRWSELGGQQQTITLTDGAVCETTSSGLECRDDTTGAPTLPLLATVLGPQATPPDVSFGYNGISGGLAAFTATPAGPVTVTVRAVKVRGGATAAEAWVATAPHRYAGTPPDMYTAAAGPLPGGATLILLRHLNPPGPTTAPVMALRVTPRSGREN
jgi:putative pyrroloquinoline-quinone binding quinoprotein